VDGATLLFRAVIGVFENHGMEPIGGATALVLRREKSHGLAFLSAIELAGVKRLAFSLARPDLNIKDFNVQPIGL